MGELLQKPNAFMKKTLFKEHIHGIYFTTSVDVLDMMEPLYRIDKPKTKKRARIEKIKRKHKLKALINVIITIGYMKYPEPGYS